MTIIANRYVGKINDSVHGTLRAFNALALSNAEAQL